MSALVQAIDMYVPPSPSRSIAEKAYGYGEAESKEERTQQQRAPVEARNSTAGHTHVSATSSRQRGIYSEFLGTAASPHALAVVTAGSALSAGGTSAAAAAAAGAPSGTPAISGFRGQRLRAESALQLQRAAASLSAASAAASAAAAASARLEPKVLVSYEQAAGRAPRRIEIERAKRVYARSNLSALLAESGVFYERYGVGADHAVGGAPCHLPLEQFDNEDYEAHAAAEWLARGTDAATGAICVPGRALRFDADGHGRYVPCDAVGYDTSAGAFVVRWRDSGSEATLHRLHVCFDAESPFDYVARVACAHRLRRGMEARIRYALYVDSMPTDELQPLDSEQVNRILLLAMNTKRLKHAALDTTTQMREVQLEFGRTMNQIVFDQALKLPDNATLRKQLLIDNNNGQQHGDDAQHGDPFAAAVADMQTLSASQAAQPGHRRLVASAGVQPAARRPHSSLSSLWSGRAVGSRGVVCVPYHDFAQHFSDLCFHSFLTKLESIAALVKVNAECIRMQRMALFNFAFATVAQGAAGGGAAGPQVGGAVTQIAGMPVTGTGGGVAGVAGAGAVGSASVSGALLPSAKLFRLDEFEQLQTSAIGQLSSYAKDKWLHALKLAIKTSLRDVKKGWLNLHERNREVYQFSKLKKFMNTVHFMMCDALRFCVLDAVHRMEQFIHMHTQWHVHIHELNNVHTTRIIDPTASAVATAAATAAFSSASPLSGAVVGPFGSDASSTASPVWVIPTSPLFTVDLILKDGVLQYTTPPSLFLSTPSALLDKALVAVSDLPQLETFVMEQLFWYGHQARLACPQREEPAIAAVYTRIEERMTAGIAPLHEYLQRFTAKYAEFIALNVDAYVAEFAAMIEADQGAAIGANGGGSGSGGAGSGSSSASAAASAASLEDVSREITSQLSNRGVIEQEIPRSVHLGVVVVNCEDARRKLIAKCAELVSKQLECFARATRARGEEVARHFRRVESELKKTPADVAELVKLREYCGTVAITVASLRAPLQHVLHSFTVLDHFSYRCSKDMFALQFALLGWPKALDDAVQAKLAALHTDAALFLTEQRSAQEDLASELLELEKRVHTFGQYADVEQTAKIHAKVEAMQAKLDELATRARHFNANESLLGLPATDYRHLQRVSKKFEPYHALWTTAFEWQRNHAAWQTDSFLTLHGDGIAASVTQYAKTLAKCLKSKALKEQPQCLAIAAALKRDVDAFRPMLPLISALRNPGMRERHWSMLSAQLPFAFQPDASHTLRQIVDELKLQQHLEVISRVGDSAGKEYQIEAALQEMEDAWRGIDFDIQPYKRSGSFVVRGVDAVLTLLDAQIQTTQASSYSPYKAVFEERISRWGARLNLVYEVIEEWLLVQRQWLSLHAIFASPDINKQLPAEGKRFAAVHKTWQVIMRQAHAQPDVLTFADNPGLLQKLQDANKLLQMVHKRLADYLDQKRAAFARFYFLANDELIHILSDTHDPTAVAPHLRKLFENIAHLEFTDTQPAAAAGAAAGGAAGQLASSVDGGAASSLPPSSDAVVITAMLSAERERVDFVRRIDPRRKAVEVWLSEVESSMKESVAKWLAAAVADYSMCRSRSDWVRKWPGQCVLNGSQVHWTAQVEHALRTDGLRGVERYLTKWREQLQAMVDLVRGELTPVQRLTMGALIVLDVHARDVLAKLVADRTSAVTDFAWIMQMRYYYGGTATAAAAVPAAAGAPAAGSRPATVGGSGLAGSGAAAVVPSGPLYVQMVQSRFPYAFEYLGNTSRLVITPLTDRCYVTLMTALQLHLGGSPSGPAGTGKTETVKDLAKAVAKQCVVFNCTHTHTHTRTHTHTYTHTHTHTHTHVQRPDTVADCITMPFRVLLTDAIFVVCFCWPCVCLCVFYAVLTGSDGLNHLAMGKFFKGLAAAGAWACFDEFNRIDVEVLSVVAQQIMTIWEAVRAGVKQFVFEETQLPLDPTCSVFVTMNPGYAGR